MFDLYTQAHALVGKKREKEEKKRERKMVEGNDDIESGKGEDKDKEWPECMGMGNAGGKITGSRERIPWYGA